MTASHKTFDYGGSSATNNKIKIVLLLIGQGFALDGNPQIDTVDTVYCVENIFM